MGATIHDVAEAAQVSIATVSRVLNGTSRVAEDKRERVMAAVEALHYTPNPLARSLLRQKTGGLGVLLPHVGGEFFSVFLNAIDQAAHQAGYFIQISCSHYSIEDLQTALRHMYRRVDGLIIMAPDTSAAEITTLLPEPTPVMFVNTNVENVHAHVLNFENEKGAYALVKHLIELGHHRIAMLMGPAHARDAQKRLAGYRQALRDHGLPADSTLEIQGDFTQAGGYQAARELLALDPRPTAVFCANDTSAIGALRALREEGIEIPGNMAIGGFDGTLSAQYTMPPLTTVAVPLHDLGRLAVERLVRVIEDDPAAHPLQAETLAAHLIVRGSTDPTWVSV